MDKGTVRGDMLTTEQAAELLGCQRRTVRRYIARGELSATRDAHGTYSVTRAALDDFRYRQQGLGGEVMDGAPVPADTAPVPSDAAARQAELLDVLAGQLKAVQAALAHDRAAALEAQLAAAHERNAVLARDNGRLQAELAHAQAALLPAPAAAETSAGDRPRRRGMARLLWWRLPT